MPARQLKPCSAMRESGVYAKTGLPITAITGDLLIGRYQAAVRYARWAEDPIDEWAGIAEAADRVPRHALTSQGRPLRQHRAIDL
jgi:hypothetical protein